MNNNCNECGKDTSFGTGLFVNRVVADNGYLCPICMQLDCDRCSFPIEVDDDIRINGETIIHYNCATAEEKEILQLKDRLDSLAHTCSILQESLEVIADINSEEDPVRIAQETLEALAVKEI